MTGACLKEVRELNTLARELRARGKTTEAAEAEKRANALNAVGFSTIELMEKYAAELVRETGGATRITQSSPEYRKSLIHYIFTGDWAEKRDVLVGQTTLSFSQLTQGGPLIDQITEAQLTEAVAQTDPLLSDTILRSAEKAISRLCLEE